MNNSIEIKKQVETSHYNFFEYVDWRRWHSYYYQLKEALSDDSKSFLIIGKGDGIVPVVLEYLAKFTRGVLIHLILMKP